MSNATIIGLVTGVAVFIVVITAVLVLRWFLRKRKGAEAFRRDFIRASLSSSNNEDKRRLSGETIDRRGFDLRTTQQRGRFYVFGIVIAALFGTLAVKLWSLQILSKDRYLVQANQNMSSSVPLPAARGRLLDRNGVELVGNRPSTIISGQKSLADDRRLVHRLSLVLGVPKCIIRKNLVDDNQGAQSNHIIARDVPMRAVAYIKEHPMLFSGVEVESRMVRYYPYGALGAHVLGYTGPVTQDVLDAQTKDDNTQYEHGDSMGKDGAELSFEGILQGMHGERVYRVDVEGNTIGIISESEPVAGGDVCLTIDAKLQQQTDRIISEIITAARQGNDPDADSGALLVMDVPTGGILAMSSFPSFTPSDLSGGISEELWAQLMSKDSKYPLSNRAIAGVYPAASTFKPFISMVAQQNEFVKEDTYHECTGFWDPYGEQWGQRCWSYPYGHGTLGLEDAIKMSCDVYFYNIGAQFYEKWSAQPEDSRDNLLQKGLSDWGFSKRSGIDLPGESPGRLPDSEWKWQTFADTPEDAMWQPGDMSNMCIGQGDLLVTPLQLVNAYSAIARGYFIKPHIFHSVVDKDGNTIVEHKVQKSDEQPPFKPEYRARVIDGLKRVVQREGVFNDLPVEMAGKTGTGEQAGKGLLSWFVGYAPVDDPQYCVACVIEQGGSGSGTAMPAVHHTLAYIYDVELGPIVAGANTAER